MSYNVVIYSSKRTNEENGYTEMATWLLELAEQQQEFTVWVEQEIEHQALGYLIRNRQKQSINGIKILNI